MNAVKMVAILLIAGGVLGLAYGGFSYTKETHEAKLGPIEVSVKDRQTVNIPVWAGVGAIVLGSALLLLSVAGRANCAGAAGWRRLAPPVKGRKATLGPNSKRVGFARNVSGYQRIRAHSQPGGGAAR